MGRRPFRETPLGTYRPQPSAGAQTSNVRSRLRHQIFRQVDRDYARWEGCPKRDGSNTLQHVVLRCAVCHPAVNQIRAVDFRKEKGGPSRQRRSVDNKSARCTSSRTTHKKIRRRIRSGQPNGRGGCYSQSSVSVSTRVIVPAHRSLPVPEVLCQH